MINVTVIEDEKQTADCIISMIYQYGKTCGKAFSVAYFANADKFLQSYHSGCDIIFSDIEMPGTDGISAMKRLRERDRDAVIIFITAIARLAVQGYSVSPIDYIVKPVSQAALFSALDNATRVLDRRHNVRVCVNTSDGEVYLDSSEITYIEVFGHFLVYHTGSENVTEWSTLGKPERILSGCGFARCNKSYLVNLRYVEDVIGDEVVVAGDRLKIGRTRYKAFMAALNEYLGT